LAKARRHLAVAVAEDGHTPPVFSAVRRDIFVEPQPKQNFSPVGAAYSDDVAPDGALAVNKLLFYKDASPTGLSHHTEAGDGREQSARLRWLRVDIRPFLRHSARMAKPALGRGLGALLGGNPVLTQPTPAPAAPLSQPVVLSPASDLHERVQRVPLDRIRPCSLQPRKDFSAEALRELADSIREQGIVQPLIVRERGGHFELIAGERRWRAAQLLQLPEVPIIVRQADDRAVLELALIENLQRENLNAIEEAHGYEQLTGQFQLTQEEIALKVGKSRAVVANALRLLKLPQAVQNFVREGRLSVGHAKVILGLSDEKKQKLAAERVIKQGLNVRQTEGLVAKLQARDSRKLVIKPETVAAPGADPHLTSLEDRLREKFGTKVQLRYVQGKGAVEISFYSDDELERILQILGVTGDKER
jgi:ParB family chromosome partitioning protein